jgi:hypothetical protein
MRRGLSLLRRCRRLFDRSYSCNPGGAARGRRCACGPMVGGKGSQPGGAERRLEELGIQLPAAPTPFGPYVETVQTGNLLFFSGMLPVVDHKPKYVGRLGNLRVFCQSLRGGTAVISARPLKERTMPRKIRTTRCRSPSNYLRNRVPTMHAA